MTTPTDHRLVRLTMTTNAQKYRGTFKKTINLQKLKNKEISQKYAFAVEMRLMDKEDIMTGEPDQQQRWNNIVEANHEAAKETLGYVKKKKSTNPTIIKLSEEQRKLGTLINTLSDPTRRSALQKERNSKLKTIHHALNEEKYQRLNDHVAEIQQSRDDSTRMFKAIRAIQSTTAPPPLVINTPDGVSANPDQQIEIVTKFFKSTFTAENIPKLPDVPPMKMKREFTKEEVQAAVKSLRNNKSAGADELKAEQLKHGPDIVISQIAHILNTIAETGNYPEEVKLGMLVPLQKPGKPKGPPSSLRPIILLSILRKILAICLLRRISNKINDEIPITQAAYRSGRSTTEQVFTMKILAEKAITSTDYSAQILLMDMSKAFDTVHRHHILEDLRSILDADELHLIKVLIEDVTIAVKIKEKTGKPFVTNIGTPQGDCLSPTLFTLYLAKALQENQQPSHQDHAYASLVRPTDHNYSKPDTSKEGVLISLQYADDISWIGINCPEKISQIKARTPALLAQRNLHINHTKTEEYRVNIESKEGDWRKCKYLGSLLDTSCDIRRRKQSAMTAYQRLKPVFQDRSLPPKQKAAIFTALISSIFLYNCEIWTMRENDNNEIDGYQRKILRWMLGIRWPAKLSDEEVYRRTGLTPWSTQITTRRLRWFGHANRLNPETPASRALNDTINTDTKKPRGGQRMTWMKCLQKDLNKANITLNQALDVSQDRAAWRQIVHKMR